MALPGRLRADQDGDVAIGANSNIGGLVAHGAADFHIGGHADTANQALLLRGLGPLWKFLPARDIHRAFHMRGEIAGVVHLAGRGLVRHRLRRNEVLAADRIRRHAELARALIDETLDDIGRLRTAGAAIGIHRHRIGEHRADAAMECLDVVETRQHAGAAMRDIRPEGRQIGAHVGHQVDIHGEKLAVLAERHACMR